MFVYKYTLNTQMDAYVKDMLAYVQLICLIKMHIYVYVYT